MGAYEGKPRTKFGRFIDANRISQEWIISNIPLNRKTVYELCNDADYNPHDDTQVKIVGKLRKQGYDVRVDDFW